MATTEITADLQSLPSVGPSLARALKELGFRTPADLHDQDPEKMYTDLNARRGVRQDPCVLYSFRCAVYAATTRDPDPELRKWWNWKGRTLSAPEEKPRWVSTPK